MKVWRLVSGILSMVMFFIVSFQSCATGVVNALDDNSQDTSDAAGFLVAIGLLVAGILSTVFRKNQSKGGSISLVVVYGLTALMGFANQGTFSDLIVWSFWALICAILAAVSIKQVKEQ